MTNSPLFSWPFIFSILVTLCTLLVSGDQCLGSQQSLLLQLKNSLDFNSNYSSKLVNWNESSDCCSWKGVTCEEEGRVTRLDLSSEYISGALDNSSTLFNLQHLRSLDLSYNDFNSTIPSRIGNLTNLSHLYLASSGFRGLDNSSVLFNLQHLRSLDLSVNIFNSTIPSRIGNLTNLRNLHIRYAGFVGQIPTEISHLRSLVTLDLSSYPLKLEIPNLSVLIQNLSKLQELYLDGANISAHGNRWCQALSSSLPNLRVLSLSYGYVPGPLDESLGELQSLSVVDLGGTSLSSPIPQSFANFSNLTVLNLYGCELHGTFPSGIFQVPTLQILDISSNHLLEGTLPEFQINNSLQTIFLSSTKFSGKLPASLGNLWNLSTLDLSTCQFNGILPSSMSDLTQLNDVDLSSNNFTGRVPSFNMSTKFTHLDLSNNHFSGSVPSFNMSTKLNDLDLSNNNLGGEIPLHLFVHPSLTWISLSNNQFSGPIHEFKTTTSSLLYNLDLSRNNLEGLVPTSIFKLGNLTHLDLSHNKFNGTKYKHMFHRHINLEILDLSCNSFKSFHGLENLPAGLMTLNLSNNHILGELPKSLFFHITSLATLDLHINQLQGNIPVLPPSLSYLDLSSNNFTSFRFEIFNNHSYIPFFSVSNNSLTGVIPEHICAIEYLSSLDLSHNNLSGKIPTCLIETSDSLVMLNLRKNNFEGPIPDVFPSGCSLKALYLNGNLFEGKIPKSLANCSALEFLDLGHNELVGKFPCLLKNISNLSILILRSNKLYGSIECPNADGSWPMLHIFDAAHNNFSGELPKRWLTNLQGMAVDNGNSHVEVLRSLREESSSYYPSKGSYNRQIPYDVPFYEYEYTATLTIKGLEMELPKILDIFTSIDLSKNNFHGQIPEEIGQLHALYALNLSHNALTGHIPSSIGNLRNLESLDLSWNNLSGTIPTQLQSLNFLQVLNLSFNQLVGMIPTGTHFQTFPEDSFIGNKGLSFKFPLKNCSDKVVPGCILPNATKDNHSNSGRKIDGSLVSAEIGLLTGFGAVVAPIVFSRRWRIWYYERVDDIIFKIFPLAVSRKWFLWTTI